MIGSFSKNLLLNNFSIRFKFYDFRLASSLQSFNFDLRESGLLETTDLGTLRSKSKIAIKNYINLRLGSICMDHRKIGRDTCHICTKNDQNFANVSLQAQSSFHTSSTCKSNLNKWCEGNPNGFPIDDFKSLVAEPVFKTLDGLYKPSEEEMKIADWLFSQHKKLESVTRIIDKVPDYKGAEVCFIGSSNVGKSSLIKSLLFNPPVRQLVVSKKPGRTRTLNFYRIGKEVALVDMPGYGTNMPEYYVQSVERYIKNRNNLQRTFLLVDSASGFTDVDRIGVNMMEEFGRPYAIVLTKIDQVPHSTVLRNILNMQKIINKTTSGAFPQIFLVSSRENIGISMLRSFILHVCSVDMALLSKNINR